MGNLINLLNGIVQFPAKGSGWFPFIGKFVYILISAVYHNGAIGYGLAIIFFTIILKLILLPLDFLNKYFTKKNSNAMAKMKPDLDAVREQYAGDAMKLNQAQREVYQKHGYKMTGFCLFTIVNLFLVMAIFFSVYAAMRSVASYNVQLTVQELQGIYKTYEGNTDKNPEFATAINSAYSKHSVGFLWIKNAWNPDVSWTGAGLTLGEYATYSETIPQTEVDSYKQSLIDAVNSNSNLTAQEKTDQVAAIEQKTNVQLAAEIITNQYNTIYGSLNKTYKRSWNGLFILIILAGATSWLSAFITSKMTATKKNDEIKKDDAQYSMRDVKDQTEKKPPAVDPAMMNRMMKIILPAMMVFFTLSSPTALAIYIITNSVLSTGIALGTNWPVDKILAWQDKRREARGDSTPEIDKSVINPHAKYFKSKRKKEK